MEELNISHDSTVREIARHMKYLNDEIDRLQDELQSKRPTGILSTDGDVKWTPFSSTDTPTDEVLRLRIELDKLKWDSKELIQGVLIGAAAMLVGIIIGLLLWK